MNKLVNLPFQESLPILPDQSVQLCFTSPPYEDMVNYRGKDLNKVYSGGYSGLDHIRVYWIELFDHLYPKVRDDGIVIIVINDKSSKRVKSISNYIGMTQVLDRGWFLVDHVAWLKLYAIAKGQNVLQDWWEHIYIFSKSNEYKYYAKRIRGEYSEDTRKRYRVKQKKIHNLPSRLRSRGKERKEVFGDTKTVEQNEKGKRVPNVITTAPDQREGSIHPARFPIELPLWGIALCTDKGDLVIDPMCGSGTTLMAAKLKGRHYYGSDIGEDYIEEARLSLSETLPQEDLFDDTEDILVKA